MRLGYKRIIIDFHFSEFPKDVLKNVDPKEYVKKVAETGCDFLLFYTKCHWGNVYHKTKISHGHKNVPFDLFGEVLEEAKRYGLKVGAYTTIVWDEYTARKHPEWNVCNHDGSLRRHKIRDKLRWHCLCINSPYRDFFFAQLKELVSNYNFSGLFLDILHSGFGGYMAPCYCPHCQELWRKKYGKKIPHPLEGEEKAHYLDFRDRFVADFLSQARKIVQDSGKNIPMTHNCLFVFDYDDYLAIEAEPGGYDYYANSMKPKILKAYAKGRDVEIYTGRFNQFWDFSLKPIELLTWEVSTILAHNAAVCIIDQPHIDGSLDPPAYHTIKESFKQVQRIEPYVRDSKVYAEIGLLFSQRNEELASTVRADFRGAFKVLTELHLPFEVIIDEHLPDIELDKYSLIVIPNLIHMKSEYVAKIRKYLLQGGKVIFCYHTATKDEYTKTLPEPLFGLVDIIGENESERSFMKTIFPDGPSYFRFEENCLVKTKSGSSAIAKVSKPAFECTEDKWVSHMVSPGEETEYPAIIRGGKGKGEFVYFNHRIFGEYLYQDLVFQRKLLQKMITLLYEPVLWVEGPKVIEANYHRKDNKIVIILTNCIVGKPTWGINNIDEIIPVHNIVVKTKMKLKDVKNMDNKSLLFTKKKGIFNATLDKINQYEVLILEL